MNGYPSLKFEINLIAVSKDTDAGFRIGVLSFKFANNIESKLFDHLRSLVV